jgi:hypothetical protein
VVLAAVGSDGNCAITRTTPDIGALDHCVTNIQNIAASLFDVGGNGLSNIRAARRIVPGSGIRRANTAMLGSFFVRLGGRFFAPA